MTARAGAGPWVGLGQLESSAELLDKLKENAAALVGDPLSRLALSEPDDVTYGPAFVPGAPYRVKFARLARGAGGKPRTGTRNPLVSTVGVVAEPTEGGDEWRARAIWSVRQDPAWRAAARALAREVAADRSAPASVPHRRPPEPMEGSFTSMVRIGNWPDSGADLGLRLATLAPMLSGDRRVRRALTRPDGFADESGGPAGTADLDVIGDEVRLRYGSVIREKSGRPVGGRHLPLVCHATVTRPTSVGPASIGTFVETRVGGRSRNVPRASRTPVGSEPSWSMWRRSSPRSSMSRRCRNWPLALAP